MMTTMTASTAAVEPSPFHDIDELDMLIRQCAVYNPSLSSQTIDDLWEICWSTWDDYDGEQRLMVGELMATLKGLYPSLPGKPDGVVLGDPEDV